MSTTTRNDKVQEYESEISHDVTDPNNSLERLYENLTPMNPEIISAFADREEAVYCNRYAGTLFLKTLAGGIPMDQKVTEGWLKSKLVDKDELLRQLVAKTMVDSNVPFEKAVEQADILKHLTGFKRDEQGRPYIEGRQLKSAIKESANIRWPKERWGPSKKGTMGYFAEHVFVVEDRLYLQPGIEGEELKIKIVQQFVHTFRGDAVQYSEYVENAKIDFTVITDNLFKPDNWADLWVTGQEQGLGSSRSQGYGKYKVVSWVPIKEAKKVKSDEEE